MRTGYPRTGRWVALAVVLLSGCVPRASQVVQESKYKSLSRRVRWISPMPEDTPSREPFVAYFPVGKKVTITPREDSGFTSAELQLLVEGSRMNQRPDFGPASMPLAMGLIDQHPSAAVLLGDVADVEATEREPIRDPEAEARAIFAALGDGDEYYTRTSGAMCWFYRDPGEGGSKFHGPHRRRVAFAGVKRPRKQDKVKWTTTDKGRTRTVDAVWHPDGRAGFIRSIAFTFRLATSDRGWHLETVFCSDICTLTK